MSAGQRQIAEEIFQSVLASVDPYELVKGHIRQVISDFNKSGFKRLLIVSFGKAAYPMARAAADYAGDLLSGGVVITKYGHSENVILPPVVQIYEAGHPVPDRTGVLATQAAIRMIKEQRSPDTLVLCLVSGGGSALFVSPYDDISLEEKQDITRLLLREGAEIQELNTVRKHLSRVKGGRLAEIAQPAKVVSLILSDVIGDPLDVIASGPTSPDRSSFREALAIIDKYNLRKRVPEKVLGILVEGTQGKIPDTPKEGDPLFSNVENRIIGSNRQAVAVAKCEAEQKGFESEVLTSELRGEAREMGRWLARIAIEAHRSLSGPVQRKCLIAGGETTVTVKGDGLGGRNTELALAFAREVKGMPGITLLSAGTDGTDGPTDAAGAVVDGGSIARAESLGLDPDAYLRNNDSYNFFKQTGDLLVTGPTGTNVMDILIVLMQP